MVKRIMTKFVNKTKKSTEPIDTNKKINVKDILMSPTVLRERQPGPQADYWVELGNNTGGAKFIRTWFAKLTGRTTWVGMYDPLLLSSGDGEVDMTVYIEPVDASIEMQRISRRIAQLNADLSSTFDHAKRGNMIQELEDLNAQLNRLRINEEKLFKTSVMMTVGADKPEKLHKLARSIIKRMSGIGVLFRSADTRQLEAFRNSIGIGNRKEFDNTFVDMESSNVADTFPFGFGGLSHRTGILLGLDSFKRPVFYNGWDRKLANQHMVILGRAGGGKSMAAKIITRRSATIGIRTGIVDPHGEYKNLCISMNCPYIELAPKGDEIVYRLNIYDVVAEENDSGTLVVNLSEAMEGVQAVLFKMIRLVDRNELTGQVKVNIFKSLKELYDKWGITTDPSSLNENIDGQQVKKRMPTLYDHYLIMQNYPELVRVIPFFEMFTRLSGDKGLSIFDGESTFEMNDVPVVGFSLLGLDEQWMKPLGTFVVSKWLKDHFGKKNKDPKRMIVDEAQHFMNDEEEAVWLENCYRELRKFNTSMCAITQGFEVFLRVKQGIGILKNAPTKLLLRQESIDIEAVKDKFNLAEGEAKFLLSAPSGVGILRVDEESTIVSIQPTASEYWYYTTNPNDIQQGATSV